jgi:quinoprotein glucose dehydrogenase
MEHSLRFTMRPATLGAGLAASSPAHYQKDWPSFGHDLAGAHYSTLKQIDAHNVTKLVRVWTYHMDAGTALAAPAPGSSDAGDVLAGGPPRDRGRGGRGGPGIGGGNSEVSPLAIDGVMYLTTGRRKVVALEPESGEEILADAVTDGAPAIRGLEFWAGDRQSPATVFFGASSGELIARNARTGKLMAGFSCASVRGQR